MTFFQYPPFKNDTVVAPLLAMLVPLAGLFRKEMNPVPHPPLIAVVESPARTKDAGSVLQAARSLMAFSWLRLGVGLPETTVSRESNDKIVERNIMLANGLKASVTTQMFGYRAGGSRQTRCGGITFKNKYL